MIFRQNKYIFKDIFFFNFNNDFNAEIDWVVLFNFTIDFYMIVGWEITQYVKI